MSRIKAPKAWKLVRLITDDGQIFYRKNCRINPYFYAVNVPKGIRSEEIMSVEKALAKFPLTFSSKLIMATNSYFYTVVPHEVCELMKLKEGDVVNFRIESLNLWGKLKRKSNSLLITIPSKYARGIYVKKRINITIIGKAKPSKRKKSESIKDPLLLDQLLPQKTSRDGNRFRISQIDKNKLLIGVDFKHVYGKEFKYRVFPRKLDARSFCLFAGLMYSDGFKKFAFKDVYKKHIFSPTIKFTNGDPYVIKLFIALLEKLFRIRRAELSFALLHPLILSQAQYEELTHFWYEILDREVQLKIYRDTPRKKRWCPAGIMIVEYPSILAAEVVICLVKEIIPYLLNRKSPDILRQKFMEGVLIGDGSPILDKGVLRRFMIAIEFREEGETYRKILKLMGFESRNLWPKDEERVKSYLRKVDIRGASSFLKKFVRRFSFGFWTNNEFYGSIEKTRKTIVGLLAHRKLNEIEKIDLEEQLMKLKKVYKVYIERLSFLPIPKQYVQGKMWLSSLESL